VKSEAMFKCICLFSDWPALRLPVLGALTALILCLSAEAGTPPEPRAKVIKVLPQLLDAKGRYTLSPSLYERDAYQFYLRKHPKEILGLRLAVEWKAPDAGRDTLKIRAELRGALSNSLHSVTLEEPVKKSSWFGNWSEVRITGQQFQTFGDLVAWRVTLLDNDQPIAQQESFIWSGVGKPD
jgi:hypothetical protein